MNFKLKTTVAAAALTAFGTVASAGIIDFTDDTTGTSGAIDGIGWTLTVVPGPLNQNEGGPNGAAPTQELVGDNDGIGIGDDEISFPRQYATLEFEEEVTITSVYWLDLFISEVSNELPLLVAFDDTPVRQEREIGFIGLGEGIGTAEDSFVAQVLDGQDFGYGKFATEVTGKVFSFWVNDTNDGQGNPDAALAAVEIAPIPLPAGIFLLGGALAGLGLARRRKS